MGFATTFQIGSRWIGRGHPAFLIAEAGVNHNGDVERALALIDVARDAGADAVKFQSFKTEELILQSVAKAEYQTRNKVSATTQFEMLKQLELSVDQMARLKEHADHVGITFLTTPFDDSSLDELDELGVEAIKIASTDLTNVSFVRRAASKGKPIFLSSGMSYLGEISAALEGVRSVNSNIVLLQCTGTYPAPAAEVNLAVLELYRRRFDVLVGFSDHTEGIGAAPYAAALGASVLEKHFTLDKNLAGPDHRASLDPGELAALVREVRLVEQYMGDADKAPTKSEANTRKMLQKCLVSGTPIAKGDVFTRQNVTAKRTGGVGLSAIELENLLGQRAHRSYDRDDIIELP